MATEGTFGGNNETPTDITSIVTGGFDSFLKSLSEISNKIDTLVNSTNSIHDELVGKRKDDKTFQKLFISTIKKQHGYIKSEAERISDLILNKSDNGIKSTSPLIVRWDDDQFKKLNDNATAKNLSDSTLKTIKEVFSLVLDKTFTGKTKKFNKAFDDAINGITNSLTKFEKSSHLIEKGSKVLITSLDSINDAVSKNNIAPKIKSLASGVAMLGLSLVGFALVSPAILVAVGALSLLKGVTFAMANSTSKDMLKISASIALFGLAIWGLSEVVTLESTLKTATAIIMLGLAIKGFTWAVGNGMGKRGIQTLLLTTITIAALGIALHTYNGVEWESMAKGAVALTALTGAIIGLSMVPQATAGATSLAIGAAAIGIMGLGLAMFPNNSDIYLPIGVFIAGYGATLALAGTVSPLITAGAIAMGIAGGALVLLGLGMGAISAMNYNPDNIDNFAKSLKYLFTTLGTDEMVNSASLGVSAMIPLLAATTMAVVVGLELALISYLSYNPDNITKFGVTINELLNVLGNTSTLKKSAIASLVAVPLLAASSMGLVIGIELALLSKISYNPENITQLGTSMSILADGFVNTYNKIGFSGIAKISGLLLVIGNMAYTSTSVATNIAFASKEAEKIEVDKITKLSWVIGEMFTMYTKNAPSFMQLPKLMATTNMVEKMALSTYQISKGIGEFTKIADKPEVIDSAVQGIGTFVTNMIQVLVNNADKLKNMPKGVTQLLGIGSLMKDVADGMSAMGNMEYYDTKLVNGRIVRIGEAKKFNKSDFDRVGNSLGLLIQAVAKPLEEIGDSGGWFGSNKTKKGIEAISNIGSVFNPIIEVVQSFKGGDKSISSSDVSDVGNSVTSLLLTMSATFKRIESDGTGKYFDSKSVVMQGVRDVFKSIGDIKETDMKEVGKTVNEIFNRVSDDKPFNKLNANLQKMRKEATLIKNEINKFDLRKLTIFSEMTKNLLESSKTGNLERLINAIRILVDEVKEINTAPKESTSILPPSMVTNGEVKTDITNVFNPKNPSDPNVKKSDSEKLAIAMSELMEGVKTEIKNMSNKLQNPLPVKVVNSQPMV